MAPNVVKEGGNTTVDVLILARNKNKNNEK